MILKKLLRHFRPEWTPNLLEVCGFALLVVAIGMAFGVAPALAATGIALVVVGYSLP